MKLILAQGNPEPRFDNTRHNVGFALLDAFAKAHQAEWSDKPKFHAAIAEVTIEDEKVLLAKPTTYYNETGVTARSLKDFYKIEDILVIHDDLALPFGTIRIRSQGSDAGNNGIKSINAHIGEAYRRLRVGTWNDLRDRMDDVDFVLGKFSKTEIKQLERISETVNELLVSFIQDNLEDHSLTLDLDKSA